MIFLWLVTSGQATIYLVRERQHFWQSRSSRWLAISSGVDVLVVLMLAWRGVMMAAIGIVPLGVVLGTTVIYLLLVDLLKGWIFRFARLPR
jgi:H+-transporting ATPase